ncbi:MAG TPA: glucose sorbosone dehydrogenase, partial [Candidatus Marinimicrobia bacterium]|nr:glucose sorbosone dehydrogenase [Candidatus Neomarinimicrobiota bacterium]
MLYAEYSVEDAYPAFTFTNPVGIESAGDGSNLLFVMEQPGRIYTFENNPTVSERYVFLDIGNIVNDNQNEEGLLGLTFHTNYAENG